MPSKWCSECESDSHDYPDCPPKTIRTNFAATLKTYVTIDGARLSSILTPFPSALVLNFTRVETNPGTEFCIEFELN